MKLVPRRWRTLFPFLLCLGFLACSRGRPAPLPSGALRGSNVLLVTIDTLRADRVGAYGSQRGLTPTLDRLSAEGIRFANTYAHAPMTLPSHASLLTGRYPLHNGVRDNGTYRLAETQTTIAAAMKSAGYRTGAFVGAFVLDARFGLNRNFDVYDDRMLGSSADLEVVQRPAEAVLAAAYEWLTGRPRDVSDGQRSRSSISNLQSEILNQQSAISRQPFFLWVHLYDPHEPYTPPEPYRSRYSAEPYDGEIAYADGALGSFLDRLRSAGALANTLIVVASDHGESLGEHGERTHGLFAYNATLRVPLIIWAPGRMTPSVFERPMRLVDVVPTVLDLEGVAPLADTDGRSVRPFLAGERPFDDRGSYFEALNANLTRGWAPLTGIVYGNGKVIDLPVPELYDLASDPGEQHNVYAQSRERARDLEGRLDRVAASRTTAPAPTAIDADAEARLRSLGYVVSSAQRPDRRYTAADDPKNLVHLNGALDEAAALWTRGDGEAAVARLRQVITDRPDLTVAYDRLAFMLRTAGQPQQAVAVLDEAARDGHADRSLLRSLGMALRDAGDLKRSASVLEELARSDPSDLLTADALGQTYAGLGRARDAEQEFRRVLSASPNAAVTWSNLGALYLSAGRVDDGLTALERAVAIDGDLPAAHNALGVAYARKNQADRAAAEWKRALELRPGYPDAIANLERLKSRD